jgi:glycosyltransferase involved in cell wall biosynthesis
VAAAAREIPGVSWLGALDPEGVRREMRGAAFLVTPSLWYEGFPVVVAEAYATGLPVLASAIGSLASLVEAGRTGAHHHPGDASHLAASAAALAARPDALAELGRGARRAYEERYDGEASHRALLAIYERAGDAAGRRRPPWRDRRSLVI